MLACGFALYMATPDPGIPLLGDLTGTDQMRAPPSSGVSTIISLLEWRSAMVSLIIVPLILFCMVYLTTGKIRQPRWRRQQQQQQRAVTCDVGGEAGIAKRNRRFLALVETPWEGATTMAILFEQACERFSGNKCLGTRTLVREETEVSADGRRFEKVTLGNYFWITYELALQRVRHFASGLVAIGHQRGERLAIFSETRAEWFLALQGSFRHSITVVTIYASLGEAALAHSLNELKKLMDLSKQLMTIQRVVLLNDFDGNLEEPMT